MKGKAFIEMQRQDLVTYNGKDKDVLVAVVDAMEAAIADHHNADIDPKKNAKELYDKMADKARKERLNVFAGEPLKQFILEYLEIKDDPVGALPTDDDVNLEDFF